MSHQTRSVNNVIHLVLYYVFFWKYTFLYIYRQGSVIADFVINFQQTGNATVLPAARKVLNDSVAQPQNPSSFGGLQIDPGSVEIDGKTLQFFMK